MTTTPLDNRSSRTALSKARWVGVVLMRLAGLACVLLALRGWSVPHQQAQPRHIVYLVDQSSSIDANQTQWIARRLASLEAIRPRTVLRTVLAFGEQAQVLFPVDQPALTDPNAIVKTLASSPINRSATNLEGALLASLAALPSQERGRVILLSDGRQTVGDVERVLGHLRRFGLAVYPVVVPPSEPEGLVWEQLAVPAVVQQGSSVPLKLVFSNQSHRPQPVEITVSLNGLTVARRHQRLRAGWQVVSMSVPAFKVGTMRVEVSVAFPNQPQQRQAAYVEIEGPPQLLLVLDRPTELPLLATALKHRGMGIEVATPGELPTDAGKLFDYEAILLFNVPKSAFTSQQVEALEQYVRRFGGGMVMVGLGGKLDEEITHEAPLDRLLPVRFEPKGLQETKRRVCILLVIDRSASMMGPRIAATKRAAVELVKQLAQEDLVGVLAFDTVPYVIVEVQPAGQVSAVLIDKLVRLKSTGGTDLLPALKAAQARVELTGATVKHMIVLSDGNTPFDSKAYRQLLSELNQQRITLSTIGIGSAFVNTDLLDSLAKGTGGTFYQMTDLDELPRLIARDTQKALGQLPFTEGYFRPSRLQTSEWFGEITDWPALKGYLTTTAKPGSSVELGIRQKDLEDPLLTHWPVGMGRVVVFTSDADTRWTPDWIRWPQFEGVWAQVVRVSMRPRLTEELFVWVEEQGGLPSVVIEGDLSDLPAQSRPGQAGLPAPNVVRQAAEQAGPTAGLFSTDGRLIPLSLVQLSRFRWRSSVDHVESGWYQLVVEARLPALRTQGSQDSAGQAGKDLKPVFAKRWIQIGRPTSDLEQSHLPPDEGVLRRIAQATQGTVDVPDRAFLPPTEWVQAPLPLRGWLLPLVVLLLLADVALRGRTML